MTDEPKGRLIGKAWYIPEDAQKPERANKKNDMPTLLLILREQKSAKMTGGIYHKIQIELTYNSNHFRCIDMVIDQAGSALNEKLIKELHFVLKTGTSDSRKDWFAVGEYKKLPNEVRGNDTTLPENVADEIRKLLTSYNELPSRTFEDIVAFYVAFERIHPF